MNGRKCSLILLSLCLLCYPSLSRSGMFDFFKKGMTESWTTNRDNLSFCDGSLVVIEDGYRLLKMTPDRRHKEKSTGVWGFRVKLEILSRAGFADYLYKRYSAEHDRLANQLQAAESSGSRSLQSLLAKDLYGVPMGELVDEYFNITYTLQDEDGFHLASSSRSYSYDEDSTTVPVRSLIRSAEGNAITIIHEGTIKSEDIGRVGQRKLYIDGVPIGGEW